MKSVNLKDKSRRIDNRTLILGLLLVSLALAARIIPGPRTIDDSYITFRYARNLLAGEGFVYNPGQQVMGTTTPLYTLLMSALGVLSGGTQAPFPWLALGLNSLADSLTCLLLWRLGKKLHAEWAGYVTAMLWAVAPFSVTFAIGGLETSLYIFLLTASVYALIEKRRFLTALFAALALLTRPDALLLLGPLGLERLWQAWKKKEKIQINEMLAFGLPVLAWGIYATFYFGSPIPHSVQAKVGAYHLEAYEGAVRLMQHYATVFHQHYFLGQAGILLGVLIFPFLFYVGARQAYKQEKALLAFMLYPWLYLLVFSLANPLIFRWYLTPPLPAYFLGIMLGLDWLLKRLFKLDHQPNSLKRRLLAGIILLLPVFSMLNAWESHPDHGLQQPAPQMAWYRLELLYRQAADYLTPQIQPGQTLAAGDVGVLGFFTNARILDTVGLNSPESLPYYPLENEDAFVTNYVIPAALILDQQPDWLVILEVYGRNTLLKDENFLSEYQLVKTLPNDIYGSKGMLIFKRLEDPK